MSCGYDQDVNIWTTSNLSLRNSFRVESHSYMKNIAKLLSSCSYKGIIVKAIHN